MKKYWDLIKADFIKYMPWSLTISFYVFALLNDYISSLLTNGIPGIQEQNPFARDEAFHFVLHKGIMVDVIFGICLFLTVVVAYHIVKLWNKLYATVFCNSVLAYFAWDRLFTAVATNYMFALHMYVKDKEPSFLKILGLS